MFRSIVYVSPEVYEAKIREQKINDTIGLIDEELASWLRKNKPIGWKNNSIFSKIGDFFTSKHDCPNCNIELDAYATDISASSFTYSCKTCGYKEPESQYGER